MNKDTLREKLNRKYDLETWREILWYMFPNAELFESPREIENSNEKVKQRVQLGRIDLADGKSLAVFEVQLDNSTDILRNRVELRNLTADLIDEANAHGTLAVFLSNTDDYRFTFAAKNTVFDENMTPVTHQTEAKRYTYVLGPNETCKTPADRFHKLHGKTGPIQLEDVIDAFSVETLNKEFFNKYKENYEDFVQFITGKRFKKVGGKWQEVEIRKPHRYLETVFDNDEKRARDFVKKLLGRIVFLQFLQKKGWMGCPPEGTVWENGNHDFCRQLFEKYNSEKFHSKHLTHLFDTLNTSNRVDDIFEPTNTRVPYLNGGLFEADDAAVRNIDFPKPYFDNLFNFFGEYNFTIDENDPDDHEVGIDPEMLGHIFENLLEDNKDKGAFYTPKSIVQYMCQESIIQYLKTHLENCEDEKVEKFIRTFDKGDEKDPDNYILKYGKRIEELLDKVKILDPAIGSGAFPMGILQIIFNAKATLDWTLDRAGAKRDIIQNSIYGVDIEQGAVDIARLRFWLSLIVDAEEPQALPNLDYKIMQGNSLLESFEGVDLSQVAQNGDNDVELEKHLFGHVKETAVYNTQYKDELKQSIQRLMKSYFSLTDTEHKREIKNQINKKIHKHIDHNLKEWEKDLRDLHEEAGRNNNLSAAGKKTVDRRKNAIDSLQEKRKKLHALQDKRERPYFLWHLFFDDVFKDGGFDIVIANPPYIQLQKDIGVGNNVKYADLYKGTGYETFKRTGDIYALFYEVGINMLKERGHLTYITSSKWMRARYGDLLRGFFAKHNPKTLVDFGGVKVFESATVDVNIIVVEKSEAHTDAPLTAAHLQNDFNQNDSIANYVKQKGVELTDLSDDTWFIGSRTEIALKQKIEEIGTPLKEWDVKINYGIKTGYNPAFVIDEVKRAELISKDPKNKEIIKPILRGKDIKRYGYDFGGLYLLYIPWHFPLHKDPMIKGASKRAEAEFKKQYSAIYYHLLEYKKELAERNKSETGIRYEWYALQRSASTYYPEFAKEKVVWKALSSCPSFCYVPEEIFNNDKVNLLTSGENNTKYLCGYLNSKLFQFYFNLIGVAMGQGYEYKVQFINRIPVAVITSKNRNLQKSIEALVDQITASKKTNPQADTATLEAKIDTLVYQLYNLTDAEIKIIEDSV